MALRTRTIGAALWLLALAGCLSPDKARLLDSFPRDPVKDLDSAETPRVSRSQSPPPVQNPVGPPPLQATPIGKPPPMDSPPPIGNPPPFPATQPSPLPPTPAPVTPPPVTPPTGTSPPTIQPVVSKVVAPELPGRPTYQVKVAAWVNSKPIFHEDIVQTILPELARLGQLPQREATERAQKFYDMVLDQLIDRELLYQDAMGKLEKFNPKGLKKLKELQKEEFQKHLTELQVKNHMTYEQFMDNLRRSGMTLQHLERMEERKFFADEYLRSRVFPLIQRGTSYAIIKEYYDNHASEFQALDNVDWQNIFIAIGTKRNPTREQAYRFAVEIANRLRRGEDLLRLLEFDDGDAKSRNGEGQGHQPDQISPPELARFLFGMREGEVGPIVEIPTGFHIIRVSRREFAGPIPFDVKTQKLIANKLRAEIFERENKRLIYELRSRALIEKVGRL
jgi:parvulin-like peptidyl-prolyl isomerase